MNGIKQNQLRLGNVTCALWMSECEWSRAITLHVPWFFFIVGFVYVLSNLRNEMSCTMHKYCFIKHFQIPNHDARSTCFGETSIMCLRAYSVSQYSDSISLFFYPSRSFHELNKIETIPHLMVSFLNALLHQQ